MKKLLSSLLASSILLSNLSLSFATETTQTNPQEEILQQITTETLSATLSSEAAAAYVGVIENIIATYGENASRERNMYETGLCTAKLIDFDGDGVEELYVSYVSKTLVQESSDSMAGGKYISEEIWSYTPSGLEKIWNTNLDSLDVGNFAQNHGSFILPHQGRKLLVVYNEIGHMYSHAEYEIYEIKEGNVSIYETIDIDYHASYTNDNSYEVIITLNGVETSGEYQDEDPVVQAIYGRPGVEGSVSTFTFSQSNENYDLNGREDLTYVAYEFFWDSENPLPQLQAIASATSSAEATKNQLNAIKAQLPYTGNLSTMNMSAEQAIAMAEQVEALHAQGDDCYVALFDDGTRVPALAIIQNDKDWSYIETIEPYYSEYRDEMVYEFAGGRNYLYLWNQNKASLEEFLFLEGSGIPEVEVTDDKTFFHRYYFTGDFSTVYYPSYNFNGGQLERSGYDLLIVSYDTNFLTFDEELNQAKELYDITDISIDENHIYQYNNPEITVLQIIDGVSVQYDSNSHSHQQWNTNLGIYHDNPASTAYGNWVDAKNVASLLRQYAELSQFRFQLPEFSQNTDITSLFDSLNLQGTLLECYQVTDNFYYVIMDDNGTEKGYLICAVKENGEVVYKIVHESTEILAEDTLVTEGNHYAFDSNIFIEFDALKDFTKQDEYVSYFSKALQNITGIQLNDQGKSELALSMQDSIVNFATYVKNLSSETGEIHQAEVSPLVEKSNSLYQDFLELLRTEQAELNKEIEQTVRVVLQGLDEKNWTIYLNPDLIGELEGNHLQVFLSSGQQGVEISADDLEALLTAHNGLFINVQETGSEQYAISFADGEGNHIEKLENAVKIFLPTSNEFSTVLLEYAQGTENWGGQFNSATNTIQFSTIHSGTYLIVDNSVEIHDVSEEYLSMVQFMVSKGFFTVDDSGNFNPYGTMSRNDFTKTIVSMFFALDHDLKSSFPDVYEDSPYYSYIASGEARDIVAGYDDGYFYGDTILTEEMAFASIAQTLVDKKGYIYPDDNSFYLNSVSGGSSCSDWAESGIALSVRDSIILPSETINPTEEIARQDAAAYLYRLFMLLEEKQQINFELVEEISLSEDKTEDKDEDKDQTLLYAAVGALALGGFALSQKGKKNEEKEV